MPDPAAIDHLLKSPHVWRMGELQRMVQPAQPTGFDALDTLLPDGGWPAQGLVDVHCDAIGFGEMSLLLQSLRGQTADRGIAWVNPPAIPYGPALLEAGIDPARVLVVQPENTADTLWAAEQILRSGAVGTVFFWLRQPIEYSQLRRLHLAAEAGRVTGFLFRSKAFINQPSPAPLRITLSALHGRVQCDLFKARSLVSARQAEVSPLQRLVQPAGPVAANLFYGAVNQAPALSRRALPQREASPSIKAASSASQSIPSRYVQPPARRFPLHASSFSTPRSPSHPA